MDKARTPVRRVKLGEDFPGQATGASGEGNEQGVSGAATSSKTSKGLTLKKPKRPEDVVKPLANEAFCQFMKTYKDKE
jgi:Mrp family chromosome partitioning ATPase